MLDSIEIKRAFFVQVALGQKQFQNDEEADDGVSVEFEAFIVVGSICVWGSETLHNQIDVVEELIRGRFDDKLFLVLVENGGIHALRLVTGTVRINENVPGDHRWLML